MRPGETALRLTVYVGEADQWQHRPLYSEIVRRAHAAGLAGAAVVRGLEGFGGRGRIHTSRVLSLSENLPVVVVIVDDEAKVRAFLPELVGLVDDGLAVVDRVEVVHAGRHDGPPPGSPHGQAPDDAQDAATP